MSDADSDKTQILGRPAPAPGPSGPPPVGILRCVDPSVLGDAGAAEIRLQSGEVTVGRGSDNTVSLKAHGISRRHARLFHGDGAWQVEDLGSTNGTRVNNSLIDQRALEDGDTVAFGRAGYKYLVVEAEAAGPVVDLGAADQTVVMRPGEMPQPVPPVADMPPPATRKEQAQPPGAEQIYDTGRRRAVEPERSSNNLGVIVGLLAIIALAGAGAAFYFGLI